MVQTLLPPQAVSSEYKINPETGCWEWQRYVRPDGYGKTRLHGEQLAHRAYYREYVGPIPEGLSLDHLCRVRHCVNPEHLEPVPHAVNVRRGAGTKLTWDDVCEIRASSAPHMALAERYGVSDAMISNVRSGKNWVAA